MHACTHCLLVGSPLTSTSRPAQPSHKRVTLGRKSKVSATQSPTLTKKTTGASKRIPASSPSLMHKQKQTSPKPSPRGPMTGGKTQPTRHHSSKSLATPPSSTQSAGSGQKLLQHERKAKQDQSESKAAEHERIVKAKAGFPLTVTKIDKEKLVSTDEEHENSHVKEKQVSASSTPVTYRQESGYSSTTVGSRASVKSWASEQVNLSHMLVSLPGIATNSEQIFGIKIPNVMISGDEENELYETIARRVSKWKMLGRYLGLKDEDLNEIEMHNHFTGERCLKMLKKFKAQIGDEATYVRLAIALKNSMHDSLVTDISSYFPQYSEESQYISCDCNVQFQIEPSSDPEEMGARLKDLRDNFQLQKNNGRNRAMLEVCYPPELASSRASTPLYFELNSLDISSVRVIEDVCIAAGVRRVKQLSISIKYE